MQTGSFVCRSRTLGERWDLCKKPTMPDGSDPDKQNFQSKENDSRLSPISGENTVVEPLQYWCASPHGFGTPVEELELPVGARFVAA